MKKATTVVRKTRAKSPAKTPTSVKQKAALTPRVETKVLPMPSLKSSNSPIDNSFLAGLVVVVSGILALIIFLSMFFRFMLGFALYNQLNDERFIAVENQEMIQESEKLEATINGLLNAESSALSNSFDVNSSEFMELPTQDGALADLNFVNSPDGSKFAYVVRNEEGKYAVMLNDVVSPYYDEVLFMTFSPDSSHFAYGAELNGREFAVIDGKEGKAYDWIFMPRFFTPDSKYFVYKARTTEGDMLVFNEAEQEMYEQIYNPFISSDKTEMIYYARRGNKIYKNSLALEKYEE